MKPRRTPSSSSSDPFLERNQPRWRGQIFRRGLGLADSATADHGSDALIDGVAHRKRGLLHRRGRSRKPFVQRTMVSGACAKGTSDLILASTSARLSERTSGLDAAGPVVRRNGCVAFHHVARDVGAAEVVDHGLVLRSDSGFSRRKRTSDSGVPGPGSR